MKDKRIYIMVLSLLVVVLLLAGGISAYLFLTGRFTPIRDHGDDVRMGFTPETLMRAPSAPDSIPERYSSPPRQTALITAGYSYSLEWSFLMNTVWEEYGSIVDVSLTNTGTNRIYVERFGIWTDWCEGDAPFQEEVGYYLDPSDTVALGHMFFPGPDHAGNHSYSIQIYIHARQQFTSKWREYGWNDRDINYCMVEPLKERSEYSLEANTPYYYDLVNSLVNPYDPVVRDFAERSISDYHGEYSVFQLCALFDTMRDELNYTMDPAGADGPDTWASPRETLSRGGGDCEDHAMLFCAAAMALGGTTRLYLTDNLPGSGMANHAFAAVYIGDNSTRDGVMTSLKLYYNTDMKGAWFHDQWGNWLIADPLNSKVLGEFPLGGEPVVTTDPGVVTWDMTSLRKLVVLDVVGTSPVT